MAKKEKRVLPIGPKALEARCPKTFARFGEDDRARLQKLYLPAASGTNLKEVARWNEEVRSLQAHEVTLERVEKEEHTADMLDALRAAREVPLTQRTAKQRELLREYKLQKYYERRARELVAMGVDDPGRDVKITVGFVKAHLKTRTKERDTLQRALDTFMLQHEKRVETLKGVVPKENIGEYQRKRWRGGRPKGGSK